MDGVRILLKLVWKSLAKLLKRLGLGVFLVPVAALGMAMFGVQLWTVAAGALAPPPAIWAPAAAAPPLPVTLVGAGLARPMGARGSVGLRATVNRAGPR